MSGKIKHRRSVSMSARHYLLLTKLSEMFDRSCSSLVEEGIEAAANGHGLTVNEQELASFKRANVERSDKEHARWERARKLQDRAFP